MLAERLLVAAVMVVVLAGCTVPSLPTTSTAPPASSTAQPTLPTPPPATSAASAQTASAQTAPAETAAAQTAPAVGLAAFAGTWSGHTRSLTVSASGVGHETVSDGCCTPEVDLTFQLSNPRGTSAANATATATVTAVALYAYPGPAPTAGRTGTVSLSDGVLTDSLGGATFCDRAAAARSACGA